MSYKKLSPDYRAFATKLMEIQIPSSIQEAIHISEWNQAITEELRALEKNGTWEIVNQPLGKKPMECKQIFIVKHNADGSVDRFKDRLVAKGFTQAYSIDYQETFAPVAKPNTI